MPDLDSYFKMDNSERDSHPLIRLLDVQRDNPRFGFARVQVIRPRAALGFHPARLSLQFFDDQSQMYDYKTEPWDPELNDALVERNIRATDISNEIERFGLVLDAALQHIESRYGDGFFSAVMMRFVDQSPFAMMSPVQQIRSQIKTNQPFEGGHSATDCSVMIQATLHDRWLQLRRNLNYEKPDAERILAGALAYYLDERFSLTDSKKLGWWKSDG